MSDELIGRRLGKYVIRERIGRGGMANVYSAWDPDLQKEVAIKVLKASYAEDEVAVARFREEAQRASELSSHHAMRIYDINRERQYEYIVMELIRGGNLADLIAQAGSLAPWRAAEIVAQVAEALDQAHQRGIVHRDVKPSNIMIDPKGRAVLADFGLARITESLRLTLPEQLVGTAEYMSPEQVRGEDVGPASDIYSLGLVAYEMLSGRVPFTAESSAAVLRAQVRDTPPPLFGTAPELPMVAAVVHRALAKAPADRWPSASSFADALTTAANGRVVASPNKPKRARRPWMPLAGALLALVVLALLVSARRILIVANVGAATQTADNIAAERVRRSTSEAMTETTLSDVPSATASPNSTATMTTIPSTATPQPPTAEPSPPSRPTAVPAPATAVVSARAPVSAPQGVTVESIRQFCQCQIVRPGEGVGTQKIRVRWLWNGELATNQIFDLKLVEGFPGGEMRPSTGAWSNGRECPGYSPGAGEWCFERNYEKNCGNFMAWQFMVQVIDTNTKQPVTPLSNAGYLELAACEMKVKSP